MSKQKKQPFALSSRVERGFLAAILFLLYAHSRHFEFIQDDSFITFRYVRHLLAGDGLVWNIGERVEGYTTFLWTALIALCAKSGLELISAAQILGVVFGLATLVLLYILANTIHTEKLPAGLALAAPLLTAANTSVAYWTISGMETSLFMCLTVLSVWLFLKERVERKLFGFTPIAFALLSFTRPEGMFLFGLTMVFAAGDILISRTKDRAFEIKRLALWVLIFAAPVVLFTLWRLSYYGYLFPNTYYAKAGLSREYFNAGLDYFMIFSKHYMLWGLLPALALLPLVRRKWPAPLTYIFFIVIAYTAYIVTVGGDVLPAHRFFIPILPLIYFLVQEGLSETYSFFELKNSAARYLAAVAAVPIAFLAHVLPYDYVRDYWMKEQGLVQGMADIGSWLRDHSTPSTTFAASTIGSVGYYSDLTLVDMLGLTDETIAHKPEKIFGVKSGWRERNYNVTYVLSRKPDWILFSTGIKPSAFAERALFTKEEFRRWYYPYYFHPTGDINDVRVIYKRSPEPVFPSDTTGPQHAVDNEFINQYYEGVNRSRRTPDEAIQYFRRSLALAPHDFALLYQDIGSVYRAKNNPQEAVKYYEQAVAADPRMVESQLLLGYYARAQKNYPVARAHLEQLVKYSPDYTMGWTLLGETYVALGDTSSAQKALRKALEVAQNNGEANQQLQLISRR